jgi:hypothetical protein
MESKRTLASSRATTVKNLLCNKINELTVFIVASALLLSSVVTAYSAQSTLVWDAVNDPAVAGYKLHYGETPGTYTNSVDSGKTTSYTLNNLVEGKTYYFAATTYDSAGNQSRYSNEVSKAIPVSTQYALMIAMNGSGTGTVTGSGISCGSVCTNNYAPGTVVTLTAAPASGSTFAGWSGACTGTGNCTVTMNASASVTATFNSTTATYDVTATATGKGTITALNNPNVSVATSGDTTISIVKVTKGANQQFTVTPNTGYYVVSVVIDGTTVASNIPEGGYSYTFSNVTASHTISATFAIRNFHITASAGTGGSISPADVWVQYQNSQTITITPASGYKVSDVKVDGTSVGAVTSYTFSSIAANHTISATFALSAAAGNYSITAYAGTGGTISPAGTVSISAGSSKSFTITPKSRYRISDVKVDGVSKGAISTYTFSSITANHNIQASFARQ